MLLIVNLGTPNLSQPLMVELARQVPKLQTAVPRSV